MDNKKISQKDLKRMPSYSNVKYKRTDALSLWHQQ